MQEGEDNMTGLFSWPYKLTTEYGEAWSEEWHESVQVDILIFLNAGKIQPAGPVGAAFEPLPPGRFGGTRCFTTRENAEEWAALDRARALVIPRTIISQVIEEK